MENNTIKLTEKQEAELLIDSFTTRLELFPVQIANRLEKLTAVNMVRVRYHHDCVSFTVGLEDIGPTKRFTSLTKSYLLMYRDVFLDVRGIGSINRVEMFYADTVNQIKNEYSRRGITPAV